MAVPRPRVAGVDRAQRLQRALEAPIRQEELGADVGRGDLDYERYLQTRALRELQTPSGERVHRDELLFQVVHQVQELWLKQLAQECVHLVAAIDARRLVEAGLACERGVRVLRAMDEAMRVLMSLTPGSFQVIRRSLGDGSGLQSPGYAGVRLGARYVSEALDALFAERPLESAYRRDDPDGKLLRLCEQLVDLDVAYQGWLVAHFQLVRRTIGVHREVRALDGYPTKALEVRMKRALFPKLWEVRIAMTREWSREGGYSPGEPRG